MKLKLEDVRIETTRGQGPGGRHRNSTDSCVVATHIPTGIKVTVDDRKQGANKKRALKLVQERLDALEAEQKAGEKKARRDVAIHNTETIRTYHYGRGTVKDHRTGKVASIKDVVGKGKIELLRD